MKELNKKNLENLSYKDITYLLLEREKFGKNTLDLFKEIINLLELPESTIDTQIADYYTSLSTDKRFVMVDGLWDLRNRHTSDKFLSKVEEDEEEDMIDEIDEVETDDDEDTNYEEDIDDETTFDDDDDDGLSDLVVLDEDDMGLEDN